MNMSILDDFTAKVNLGMAGIVEQHCRIIINEKPKRMKDSTWQKMIRKVVCIQYYPVRITRQPFAHKDGKGII